MTSHWRTCRWRVPSLVALAVFACASSALAATYYVDQKHPEADDANAGSAERPWRTMGRAAKADLQPGDVVVVKAGVYRESVSLRARGTKAEPITFRAAPGEKVVLSGADEIGGWRRADESLAGRNPQWRKLWVAEINWMPKRVTQDGFTLPAAREPDTSWWIAQGGDTHRVVDSVHFKKEMGYLVGARLTLWDVSASTQNERTIIELNAEKHEVLRDGPIWRDRTVEGGVDRYFLSNRVEWINRPGEYAVEGEKPPYRIVVWPQGEGDATKHLFEGSRRSGLVVDLAASANAIADGFEITGGEWIGIGSVASQGVENPRVLRCIVHHNQYIGIDFLYARGGQIRRCVSWFNSHALGVGLSSDVRIEENDFGWNRIDGMNVAEDCHNVHIVRNFVHHHFRWGHADNIQFWGTKPVSDIWVRGNLVFHGGSNFMLQGIEKAHFIGNTIVGSQGMSLNGTVRNGELVGNTIAFAGLTPLAFQNRLRNNIVVSGHDNIVFSIPTGADYQGDRNVFWQGPGIGGSLINAFGTWGDWANYRKRSDQDRRSKHADPKFVNAPAYFMQTDYRRLMDCSETRLYVDRSTSTFQVGDHVELNWDGVVRTVREVGDKHIVFEPALPSRPEWGIVVANWKAKANFALDLRLASDSPGKKMADDGNDVGSNLDVQGFLRGDLDGDGERELPAVPDYVLKE